MKVKYNKVKYNKIIDLLKKGDLIQKKYALEKLRETSGIYIESLIEPLVEILLCNDMSLKRDALNILEAMEPLSMREAIRKHKSILSFTFIKDLTDSSWDVRSFAARILGIMREKDALGPLISLLNDKEGYVRYFAAEALGQIGDFSVFPFLIDNLIDEAGNIRSYVVDALKNLLKNFPDFPNPQELMILEKGLIKIKSYDNIYTGELLRLFVKLIKEKKTEYIKDLVIITDDYPEFRQIEILEINI